jgi:hypothetical protein
VNIARSKNHCNKSFIHYRTTNLLRIPAATAANPLPTKTREPGSGTGDAAPPTIPTAGSVLLTKVVLPSARLRVTIEEIGRSKEYRVPLTFVIVPRPKSVEVMRVAAPVVVLIR